MYVYPMHCVPDPTICFLLRLFTFDFNDICTAGTAVILFDSDHKYKVLNIHISRVHYTYIIPVCRVQISSWLCGY